MAKKFSQSKGWRKFQRRRAGWKSSHLARARPLGPQVRHRSEIRTRIEKTHVIERERRGIEGMPKFKKTTDISFPVKREMTRRPPRILPAGSPPRMKTGVYTALTVGKVRKIFKQYQKSTATKTRIASQKRDAKPTARVKGKKPTARKLSGPKRPKYLQRRKPQQYSFIRNLEEEFPYRRRNIGKFHLGGFPHPLGYDLIFEMGLTKGIKNVWSDWKITNPDLYNRFTFIIVNRMREMFKRVQWYGLSLIDTFVPEDTGELKKKMKGSLHRLGNKVPSAGTKNLDLITCKMRIGADIAYAGVVNNMDTFKTSPRPAVQHPFGPPYMHLNKRHGRPLIDDTAIGGADIMKRF